MQDYILIVEDDNEINHMLKELLQGRGYGVKSAYSGTELLSEIKKIYPEVAITVSTAKDDVQTRVELLISNPNKVFTKNNIYESVWNEEFVGEDNAVNVHISKIRQKLAKVNDRQTYIQTVWGNGFKMKTL